MYVVEKYQLTKQRPLNNLSILENKLALKTFVI